MVQGSFPDIDMTIVSAPAGTNRDLLAAHRLRPMA
jgi:hypothetical protein